MTDELMSLEEAEAIMAESLKRGRPSAEISLKRYQARKVINFHKLKAVLPSSSSVKEIQKLEIKNKSDPETEELVSNAIKNYKPWDLSLEGQEKLKELETKFDIEYQNLYDKFGSDGSIITRTEEFNKFHTILMSRWAWEKNQIIINYRV